MRQKPSVNRATPAGRWPPGPGSPALREAQNITLYPWELAALASRPGGRRGKAELSTHAVRLHRWDEIALEKVTEMISRKIVTGAREMLAQIYLKKGALVPMHAHESEQMTYVLQGALKFLIGGEEITVREGEVLHIPSWVEHQAEALDDTFELDVFSPIRQDWLDHTDTYFHFASQDPV
jgi:quercetin dioxygenase-like cupin family protein